MSNKKNIKSDSREMIQILSDLKVIVHNLSEIVTRLEDVSSSYVLTSSTPDVGSSNIAEKEAKTKASVPKRINTVQNNRNMSALNKKSASLSKLTVTPTRGKKKVVSVEAFNEVVIEDSKKLEENYTATHVKDIKKKFEYSNRRVQNDTKEDIVRVSVDDTKNTEINVNVRSLKQKFELEAMMPSENIHFKANEEKRRNSEEKNKSEKIDTSEQYDDKVKRILKYFQPKSP